MHSATYPGNDIAAENEARPYDSNLSTIIIGGLGDRVLGLEIFQNLHDILGEYSEHTYVINGGAKEDGGFRATTPSEQIVKIESILEQHSRSPALIVSHCLGMVAAISIAERFPTRTTVVALAPPLPTPLSVYSHIAERFTMGQNGPLQFKTYSWQDTNFANRKSALADSVSITDSLIEELTDLEGTFPERTRVLLIQRRLALVLAARDWSGTPPAQGGEVLHVETYHSIRSIDPRKQQLVLREIVNFALNFAGK